MKKMTALTLAAMLALTVCGCQQAAPEQKEESYDSLFPQHESYGTGVGAMPGRVV